MKPNKPTVEAAAKPALVAAINKATGFKRKRHGPEPERLKISGYGNWEDAAATLARAKKPRKGWPKK